MKINPFARRAATATAKPDEDITAAEVAAPRARTGNTFPADEVVWGVAIRNGFDELDDPWYHRGVTQHAYLEGNDAVSLCGFRPPRSGPRTRRRSRLGLPTAAHHPMCGICARMVVAPVRKVAVPVVPSPSPVAVPVARPATGPSLAPAPATPAGAPRGPYAVPVATAAQAPPVASGVTSSTPPGAPISPWMARAGHAADVAQAEAAPTRDSDGGLLARGVQVAVEEG